MPSWKNILLWTRSGDTPKGQWFVDPLMEPAVCANCHKIIVPLSWQGEEPVRWYLINQDSDALCTDSFHCPDEVETLWWRCIINE